MGIFSLSDKQDKNEAAFLTLNYLHSKSIQEQVSTRNQQSKYNIQEYIPEHVSWSLHVISFLLLDDYPSCSSTSEDFSHKQVFVGHNWMHRFQSF